MKLVLLAALVLAPSIADAQPGGYYANQPGVPYEFHNGLTFEGNLGIGGMWAREDGRESRTEPSVGANMGIGGFLNQKLALSLRIASVNYSEETYDGFGGTITLSAIFVGPSIQYWVNEQLWLGGGIGYAIQHLSYQDDYGTTGDSRDDPTGFALDLRVGYTFYKQMRNSLNISFEYTPGYYKDNLGEYQLNGAALLFGYQYL